MLNGSRYNGKVVIAIDFDDTITEAKPYPEWAEIRQDVYKYIPLLYEKGFILVLWTGRDKQYFEEACRRLKDAQLYQYFEMDYSLFNYGCQGKLEADYYIDDRMCYEIDWKQIYNNILKKEGMPV